MLKYDKFMEQTHNERPLLITTPNAEIFMVLHNRDLREEFNTNEYGLSKTTCMCPSCPFFKKKFTGPENDEGYQCFLIEHYPKWLDKHYYTNDSHPELNYLKFETYFI